MRHVTWHYSKNLVPKCLSCLHDVVESATPSKWKWDIYIYGFDISISLWLQITGECISRTPHLINSHELPRTSHPSRLESDPLEGLLVIPEALG